MFHYATNDQVVRWAALRDMIPRLDPPPEECCREMTLTFGTTSADGAVWRCPVCRRHKSVQGDCWLRDSKLTLRQAALLLAYWIDGRSRSSTVADCGISPLTVGRFFEEFRLIAQGLVRNEVAAHPLGAVGTVCQIDESLFGKAKYNRGRALLTHVWVFGIVDSETGGDDGDGRPECQHHAGANHSNNGRAGINYLVRHVAGVQQTSRVRIRSRHR